MSVIAVMGVMRRRKRPGAEPEPLASKARRSYASESALMWCLSSALLSPTGG